jgi:hypothetical protein
VDIVTRPCAAGVWSTQFDSGAVSAGESAASFEQAVEGEQCRKKMAGFMEDEEE